MYQAFQNVKLAKQVNGKRHYYHIWMVGFADELRATVEYGVSGGAVNKTALPVSVRYVSAAIVDGTLQSRIEKLIEVAEKQIGKKVMAGYEVVSGGFDGGRLKHEVEKCYDTACIMSGQQAAAEIQQGQLAGMLAQSLGLNQTWKNQGALCA